MHLPHVADATYRPVAEGHGSSRQWPKATAEAMGEGHVPCRPRPKATAEGHDRRDKTKENNENESYHKVINKRIRLGKVG